MAPSASRVGTSKRVPSARTGNGSSIGEMPLRGLPASQVTPKSLERMVEVVRLKPVWSGPSFNTFSVS